MGVVSIYEIKYMKKLNRAAAKVFVAFIVGLLIFGFIDSMIQGNSKYVVIYSGAILISASNIFSIDVLLGDAADSFKGREVGTTQYFVNVIGIILLLIGLLI